jgi:hypothetical protein
MPGGLHLSLDAGRMLGSAKEMGTPVRHATVFMLACLALLTSGGGALSADASRFDGRWAVTLVCPKAPDGALPYTFEFMAEVKDGRLHGERGIEGQPAWLSLDGRIEPNGDARLDANGITGRRPYNLYQIEPGRAYRRLVTAHFDADRGTGNWVSERICDFTFRRL